MLFLEDYLEMIEHLPHELKDRFTEMREMDMNVHNERDAIEEKVKVFFSNAKKMKTDQRDSEFNKLIQEYEKTIEEGEEKMELANQMCDLVEKYLKGLDSEIQKFKLELEADNSGITAILERSMCISFCWKVVHHSYDLHHFTKTVFFLLPLLFVFRIAKSLIRSLVDS